MMPLLVAERDRPRERLWRLGPGALTPTELLAILLGTGSRNHDSLATAARLLERSDGELRLLAARPAAELTREPGVGAAKAARLAAGFEIVRRLVSDRRPERPPIRTPEDVVRLVAPGVRDLAVEELTLDTRSCVILDILITRGLLDASLVHLREVFRAAIAEEAAASVILVHNKGSSGISDVA